MRSTPKISIITCVYKHEHYRWGCFNSIKNQTYKNIEHIIIDSSSSNKAKEDVEKYISEVPYEVKYFWEEPSTIYKAINSGIRKTTGDIVHILHEDDYYTTSTTLEKVVNAFNNNPEADWLFGYWSYLIGKKEYTKKYSAFEIKNLPFLIKNVGNFISHATCFFKKITYDKVGFYNEEYIANSEYALYFRLLQNCKYFIVEDVLTTRTIHKSGFTSTPKGFIQGVRELSRIKRSNRKSKIVV